MALPLAAGCLREFPEPEKPHYVRIANLDLAPAQVLSQDVVLNVTATLDNRGGGESDPMRIVGKAYSVERGFLLAENETHVGVLPGDTTRPLSMRLSVPREGSVRIELTLFEEDLAREKASISASNLGTLEPEIVDTGLRISGLDFVVSNVTGANATAQRATIRTDLYLTNEGRAANENLRLQVKAREITTSLVADVAWLETGSVPPGATLIRTTNLSVPDGYNYVFEVLTWRGDAVIARSEGEVRLAPTYEKPKDQEVVVSDPNVRDFLAPTSPTAVPTYYYGGDPTAGRGAQPEPQVPGFTLPLALAALAAVAVLVSRRKNR